MRIKYSVFCLLAGASLLTSCAPTVEPPVDTGYNYIPIDTGRYYIYNVDSIYFDCTAVPAANDTTHYQVKEFYPSTFIDGMGETVINCTRYYRADSTQPWVISGGTNVWWLKRTNTRLEKREENLNYVKMTYPIDVNYTWDGNAYNILGQQDYYYGSNNVPFNNAYGSYDSTITVYQKLDTTNMIQYYLFTETYARNIGMVHKYEFDISSLIVYDSHDSTPPANSCWQLIPPTLYWYQVYLLDRIRIGSIVEYNLIEYGFE